ncbi:MAG: hypothetical protein ACQPRI_05950 [Solitalea-like symbiont of Tyrophagus putrescentiae]
MKNTFYSYKNKTLKRILSQITGVVIITLAINSHYLYSQEGYDANEGIALSIEAPGSSKGITLPKVKLTDLNEYQPLKGMEREGLLVENTYTDESKGIMPGIYIWNLHMWDKLLNFSDIPRLAQGTKVYTGTEDPNQSSIDDIKNAPAGSLYINKLTKLVFKKGAAKWMAEVYIGSGAYNGSASIFIREDTTSNNIEAILGSGLTITKEGISTTVDNSNMAINQNLITIKSGEPLWNANKLQGTEIGIANPIDGNILQYKNSKWLNVPELIYKGKDGVLITNDTIRLLVDTTFNTLEHNHIGAKNSEPLWNANRLQGTELGITNPIKDQILKYDGSKWTNADRARYTTGAGISQIIGKTVNLSIDNKTLDVTYAKNNEANGSQVALAGQPKQRILVTAQNDHPLWNAKKLQGREIYLRNITEGDVLRYAIGDNWVSFPQTKYEGRNGIRFVNSSGNDTTVVIEVDGRMLSFVNNYMRANNENGIWNSNKLRDITIDARQEPTQDQLLSYDKASNMWAAKNVSEAQGGSDSAAGSTLIWDGSVWRIPKLDDKVTITGPQIYLPEAPVQAFIGGHRMPFIMVDSKGMLQIWNNMAWNTYGDGIPSSAEPQRDLTLGFTENSDKANLVFKTDNIERMRIESFGNTKIKSSEIYFSGLDAPEHQSKTDRYLMTSKYGGNSINMLKWSGTLWSMSGNEAIHGNEDYILGFNKDNSESNLLLRVAGKDRVKLNSDGETIITSENNKVIISGLTNPVSEQSDRMILAIDSQNRLWALKAQAINTDSNTLKRGVSSLGFTDPINKADIVFSTQNTERLRISSTGEIQMALEPSGVSPYDLVVINRTSGELSKTSLESLLADSGKSYNSSSGSSQTQVISISDITKTPSSLANLGIDLIEPYGNKTIDIVYANNKPEIATRKEGVCSLNIGYDTSYNLPGILTYAYDIMDNNRNMLVTSDSTGTIKIDDIEISFKLEKIEDTYKLIPNINKGIKSIGYLILRSN